MFHPPPSTTLTNPRLHPQPRRNIRMLNKQTGSQQPLPSSPGGGPAALNTSWLRIVLSSSSRHLNLLFRTWGGVRKKRKSNFRHTQCPVCAFPSRSQGRLIPTRRSIYAATPDRAGSVFTVVRAGFKHSYFYGFPPTLDTNGT